MLIIETFVFTKLIKDLMNDEAYRLLQGHLCLHPESGDLIKGSRGLRKMRWSHSKKGKQGGVRVIYYWIKESCKILMLYAYSKNVQEDLTAKQIKLLSQVVREEIE